MAKITVRCFIEVDGAAPVPWESLSAAELERVRAKMSERLGRSVSAYYSQHPEEYDRMPEIKNGKVYSSAGA